jgi:hypothetical protein
MVRVCLAFEDVMDTVKQSLRNQRLMCSMERLACLDDTDNSSVKRIVQKCGQPVFRYLVSAAATQADPFGFLLQQLEICLPAAVQLE